MKKFWLKLAIFCLDKIEDKCWLDFDKDEKNDLTELKEMLIVKLDNLK